MQRGEADVDAVHGCEAIADADDGDELQAGLALGCLGYGGKFHFAGMRYAGRHASILHKR